MDRNTLAFIAIAVTILYGVTVGVSGDARGVVAPVGAGIVAIMWIAVGMLGKDPKDPGDR